MNRKKKTKRSLASLLLFLVSVHIMARDYSGHRYFGDADIGLPNGNEVGIGLLIAIMAIPVGYIILKMSDSKSGEGNTLGGCIGVVFIGGGIIALLPLVAWLCAIGSVLIGIGFALFIVIGIIGLFMSKKK